MQLRANYEMYHVGVDAGRARYAKLYDSRKYSSGVRRSSEYRLSQPIITKVGPMHCPLA